MDITVNNPHPLFQSRDVAHWKALVDTLYISSDSETLRAFRSVMTDLKAWGIPREMIAAIEDGLQHGTWAHAAEGFCRLRGVPVNVYLGPMRITDEQRLRSGLVVLTKTPCGDALIRVVDDLADTLGRRTFGMPCNLVDRRLEFYDLALAAGPFDNGRGRFVALFAPDYLGGKVDASQHALIRRSILFHNVFLTRFNGITAPIARSHLRIDGCHAAIVTASDGELDEALALWLCLHEMIHGSGPLPLFRARVRKLPLGLAYAGIEEMRVDMTAWMMLHSFKEILPPAAPIARDMIMAERLLRSARVGLRAEAAHGLIERDSDAENGALWFATLIEGGAIRRVDERGIDVDLARAAAAIQQMLECVYEYESAIAGDPDAGGEALVGHAESLRRRYFGERTRGRFLVPAAARDVLTAWSSYPTHVRFVFQ